jgi:hypothetical protein
MSARHDKNARLEIIEADGYRRTASGPKRPRWARIMSAHERVLQRVTGRRFYDLPLSIGMNDHEANVVVEHNSPAALAARAVLNARTCPVSRLRNKNRFWIPR